MRRSVTKTSPKAIVNGSTPPRLTRRNSFRFFLVTALLAILFGGLFPTVTQAAPPAGPADAARYPGRILVKFRADLDPAWGSALSGAAEAAPEQAIERLRVHRFRVPPGREQEFIERFRRNPLVEYAEPDYLIAASLAASDPDTQTRQWHLNTVEATAAWDVTTGRENAVTIAVIDSGIDGTHPDLAGRVTSGYNFISRRAIAAGSNSDDYWHGTHVAGIAGANANNGIGGTGISWSARLMPLKILDYAGYGRYSDLAEAIIWGTDNGARVINMSLGGSDATLDETRTLTAAVDYAAARGVVMVAAAGNDAMRGNPVDYPAALDPVIAVGASTASDDWAFFSTYQSYVDLSAPGVSIWSTTPGGRYSSSSGTSMATPIVSGIAALILATDPTLTPAQIAERLAATSRDLGAPGKDVYFGAGRVSAGRALLSGAINVDKASVEISPAGDGTAVVTVSGRSSEPIRWEARASEAWLTLSGGQNLSGEISGSTAGQIRIGVDPARLPAGASAGTVTVGVLIGNEFLPTRTVQVHVASGESANRLLMPLAGRQSVGPGFGY